MAGNDVISLTYALTFGACINYCCIFYTDIVAFWDRYFERFFIIQLYSEAAGHSCFWKWMLVKILEKCL